METTTLSLFAASYGAVFLAEVAGDKLLYTTGVLATRYRPAPIICGVTLAFGAKMAIAVALGASISRLPSWLLTALSALTFFSIGYTLLRDPGQPPAATEAGRAASHVSGSSWKQGLASFAAIFFSEWGDIGQVSAATLAAQSGAPIVVWFAAVGAMISKAALAASAGAWIRSHMPEFVPPTTLRYCGVGLLMALGILSIALR